MLIKIWGLVPNISSKIWGLVPKTSSQIWGLVPKNFFINLEISVILSNFATLISKNIVYGIQEKNLFRNAPMEV